MVTEYLIFAGFAFVFLLAGYLFGSRKRRVKTAGKLVIDKTGDKDRWTFVLDEDLENVEKEASIVLRIELHE